MVADIISLFFAMFYLYLYFGGVFFVALLINAYKKGDFNKGSGYSLGVFIGICINTCLWGFFYPLRKFMKVMW